MDSDLNISSCPSFVRYYSDSNITSKQKIGVEIHEDVIQHSKTSIDNWIRRQKSKSDSNVSSTNKKPSSFPLKIFHGNGLNISSGSGEGLQGFDRIYVGGGINSLQLEMVKSLMCTGGILVAPGTVKSLVSISIS